MLPALKPVLRRVAVASLAMFALGAMGAPTLGENVLRAPVRNVTSQYHGVTVMDPYRYMENVRDPQVQAWLKAQGDAARQALDALPVRQSLLQSIQALDAQRGDVVGSVVRLPLADAAASPLAEQFFYLKRVKGERQSKLFVRDGLQGAERVLIDTEKLAKSTGVPHAINYFSPSWDGKYMAYGMSAGGSEDASLYVMNVATGKTIGQPVPRVPDGTIGWLPDSQSLTYNQLKKLKKGEPDTETYMDSRVMWLKITSARTAARALPLFGPTVTRKLGLARLDVGTVMFQPGSPWMLARTTDTTVPEGFLFVAPVASLANLSRQPVRWRQVAQFSDGVVDVALKGQHAYLLTHSQAPRNRLLKLDLNQPDLKTAQVVAMAPPNAVLESFALSKNAVLAGVREGTSIGIRRYPPGDTTGTALAMPYPGAAQTYADPNQAFDDVIFTLGGWAQPARTWRSSPGLDGTDAKPATEISLATTRNALAALDIEVRDVVVKSHDGAMVPMTVLHKKGLSRTSAHPTLLEGYGAYGLSETAHYSPANQVWLERGGVLAFANVRGSGVYGQDWYRAGQKVTKPNTWKDGVACAQFLIAEGYASPATLAITGGSAGGIFAGRAITQAPELFAAAVVQVGVFDAVRAELSANGITNISEFGSFKNPAEFPALLEMSAYHQIKDATAYPAVMFTHGLNDPRVDVWHSAKGAARLQAASTSGKPVLLRLDAQAGHGMGSTSTQRQQLSADVYAFLLWQMGQGN